MPTSRRSCSRPLYQNILHGRFHVASHAKSRDALLAQVQQDALRSISTISGSKAASAVRRDGLKWLHLHVPLDDIPKITEHFYKDRQSETSIWRILRAIAHQELRMPDPFYVLREVFLRILPPFSTYRDKPGYHQRRRDLDAIKYKFTSHAPHRDSWAGEAENLLNCWIAIEDIPANAGMYIIPGLIHEHLPHLPEAPYYITRDANIPYRPKPFALKPGECLLFASDELHGTCLNTSGVTRVAVSGRMCPTRPTYRPEFADRNQDEWLMSDDIDSDDPEFLKVKDSSGERCRDHGNTTLFQRQAVQIRATSYSGWNEVCLVEQIPHNQGYPVRIGDREIALFRRKREVVALDNICPHLYYRLANGPQIDGTVICPGHCMRFDLKNGHCLDDDCFRVKRHKVKRVGNRILVKLASE